MIDLAQIVVAYLLGSIPFGILFSKLFTGTDPRTLGSGNIGFTNVLRVVGTKAATYALIGDVGKGVIATVVLPVMLPGHGTEPKLILLLGFTVVIGHCYSAFLRLRGGKGVSTALGAIIGIDPITGFLLLGIWMATVAAWRLAALGALIASGLLPVIVLLHEMSIDRFFFAVGITVLIWFRHRENIRRLLAGTESHIGITPR